jgi:hypothetical protein
MGEVRLAVRHYGKYDERGFPTPDNAASANFRGEVDRMRRLLTTAAPDTGGRARREERKSGLRFCWTSTRHLIR